MLASFAPPTTEMAQLLGSMVGDPHRTEQFFGVFAGTVPVEEFFAHP